MRYQVFACALSVFAALGCSGAEDAETVGESQEAVILVNNKVLRVNAGGKCIEQSSGLWKRVNCVQPYPTAKKFLFDGDTASGFRVRLVNGGPCLVPRIPATNGDTLVSSSACNTDAASKWKVLPGSGSLGENTFQLQNAFYTSMCIHASSDNYMRIQSCVNTWPAAEAQRLLLDEF